MTPEQLEAHRVRFEQRFYVDFGFEPLRLGAGYVEQVALSAWTAYQWAIQDAALQHIAEFGELQEQALSHPKSIEAPVVFARVLDPQELRVMLQALQGGEMSVARSIELMEFWLDGNYSDDQVPPMPDDSTLLTDDEFPMELVREPRVELAALRAAAPAVSAPVAIAETLIFDDFPEFHAEGMGCGLEDRGITDRYEAMRYGWDQAIESVALNITGFLSDLPQAAPVVQLSEPTDQQMDVIYRDVWTTVPHAKRLFEFGRRVFALAAAPLLQRRCLEPKDHP